MTVCGLLLLVLLLMCVLLLLLCVWIMTNEVTIEEEDIIEDNDQWQTMTILK